MIIDLLACFALGGILGVFVGLILGLLFTSAVWGIGAIVATIIFFAAVFVISGAVFPEFREKIKSLYL